MNNKDMFYNNYGYSNIPFNPMMPNIMPQYNPYNNIESRISNIENQLNKLNQRISKLEGSNINNYNEPDNNLYML